ncbi:amino acid ABC transporter substrate-binding protein [Acinetobacter boissieri]|uniref:Amino acid ABC transporter substrate-binding protein, PAAT family n=1 Tax=Acinetobacter boissieri TaxID=1219383 RepID=A0A1G6JEQ2_9GAMM|nr:amino acid ABC transporter substrate-binding protein [Acinetobacter boissieri]SDC17169.1 amino acid ABC transporter substrate-binding protein, PAAT family [Acinetobacter boissieri]
MTFLKNTLRCSIFMCCTFGLVGVVHAADTLQKIKTSGKMTIGYSESSEPVSYAINGKPLGYAIDTCDDIATEIKKELQLPNLKVEYKKVSAEQRIPEVQSGNIDLVCDTTTNTKDRQKEVGFSINYFAAEVRFAVKKDAAIKDIQDLNGKSVSTTKGTTSEKHILQAKKLKNIEITTVYGKNHAEAFAMLESGRVVAFVQNEAVLNNLIAKSAHPKDYKVVTTGQPFAVEPYAIMFAKDDTKIKTVADKVILNMWDSGKMDHLYKKWLQSPIPPHNINLNMPQSQIFKYLKTHPNSSGIML